MKNLRSSALVSLLGASTLASCTLLFEANEVQCEVAADCVELGFANATCTQGLCLSAAQGGGGGGGGGVGGSGGADPFGCVGNVHWVAEDQNQATTVTFRILRTIGQSPVEGLTMEVCAPFDPACSPPLGSATTDANGVVAAPVNVGFRGHFTIKPPPTIPDLVPFIGYIFPPPSAEGVTAQGNINVGTFSDYDSIVGIVQKERVAGQGFIFITAVDCNNTPVSGVTVSSDVIGPDTFTLYVSDGGVPSTTLGQTSSRGEAAILNVPPGSVTVRGVSEAVGLYSESVVLVEADTITGIPVVPTP